MNLKSRGGTIAAVAAAVTVSVGAAMIVVNLIAPSEDAPSTNVAATSATMVLQQDDQQGSTAATDSSEYQQWLSSFAAEQSSASQNPPAAEAPLTTQPPLAEQGSDPSLSPSEAPAASPTASTGSTPTSSSPIADPYRELVNNPSNLIVEPAQTVSGAFGVGSTPFSRDPAQTPRWGATLKGFADNFTNTSDGWADRLKPYVTESLYQSIQGVTPRTIPAGAQLTSGNATSYREYSVVCTLTYSDQLTITAEISYNGTDWLVSTYDKIN